MPNTSYLMSKHKQNKPVKKIIIAIDGPAGSGKSTVARLLAKVLRLPYIDTGAMYRAVTFKAMREGVSFDDKPRLIRIAKKAHIELLENRAKVLLDGKDVTHAIRTPELTKNVFHVAQMPLIRKELVKKQPVLGKKNGAVMEGRDIGTVVFPKADYKFYLDADISIRSQRRYKEIVVGGGQITLDEVQRDLKRRDDTDYNRSEGPLKRARTAHVIDTTPLTIHDTVDKILAIIRYGGPARGSKKVRVRR